MNWRLVSAIARKDLQASFRNRMVIVPMFALPFLLLVVLPLVIGTVAADAVSGAAGTGAGRLLSIAPPSVSEDLARYPAGGQIVLFLLTYTLAPLFLTIPLMTAQVLAADAIVGERERGSLEAILYTPTSDSELLAGKLLGAFVPALLVSLLGFAAYTVTVNFVAWRFTHAIVFPNLMWVILVFWLGPAVAAFGLAALILVSAKATTMQGAYQMGGLLILPIILLILGQAVGLLFLGPEAVLLAGLVAWILDAGLFALGRRFLRRDRLLPTARD
ncbi:MAG: ABC transporter permease subunit [Thermoplasmatota archaeon]